MLTPVTVLVTEDRYDIVDAPTPRNLYLAQLLQAMGGVSDTVPPGTYKFNAFPNGAGQIITTLDPA